MAKPVKVKIHPEFSAQRRSHPPNPSLKLALDFARQGSSPNKRWERVADLGCGKLRHYSLLSSCSDNLYLVDTHEQLSSIHIDGGQEFRVLDVAEKARECGKSVYALTADEFAKSNFDLDLIVCVAVLDVVTARSRSTVIRSAAGNLSKSGRLIVIVPRNDSTIVDRCEASNSYQDGYAFFHHGIYTFFRNFRDHSPIIRTAKKAGLVLKRDLSRYRQVCLIFGVEF
jgi:SAM-dependent methyltransferase